MSQTRRRAATFLLFLLVSLGGGLAIGFTNPPGDWYAALQKPAFTPPDWLFPVAWTVLYVLIAVAGWRVFDRDLGRPFWRWVLQMALNYAWSPLFFGEHQVGGAFAVILLLLVAVLLFIVEAWSRDRIAALLFLPYAAWVGYASLLNGAIWRMNG